MPASERALWPELDVVPAEFVLYGGTALALQLGHRASEDFDFFSSIGFEPELLYGRLPFINSLDRSNPASWVHFKTDNLEGYVERQGSSVKLAFFGGLDTLRRVRDPAPPLGSQVWVASLVDLAGMKMRVIQVRGSWKDYVDLHSLATHGFDFPTALAAARAIDSRFQPALSVRALQFFGDGTLAQVPNAMQRDLTRWAQEVDLAHLPSLSSQSGFAPEGEFR